MNGSSTGTFVTGKCIANMAIIFLAIEMMRMPDTVHICFHYLQALEKASHEIILTPDQETKIIRRVAKHTFWFHTNKRRWFTTSIRIHLCS